MTPALTFIRVRAGKWPVAAVLTTVAVLPAALAQSATQANATFEVASVKPNKSSAGIPTLHIQAGGRFTSTNVTLRELIRVAYRIENIQIVGAPDWIRSERFDI